MEQYIFSLNVLLIYVGDDGFNHKCDISREYYVVPIW